MNTYLKTEDFYRFESLAEPQLSPNKNEILYMIRKVESGKTKYCTALFIANYKNPDQIEQITNYSENAKNARWSPCGKYISYVISNDKDIKLCIYNVLRKKVTKLIFKGKITGIPTWSANSKQVVFTAIQNLNEKYVTYDGAPVFKKCNDAELSDIRVITDIDNKFDGVGFYGSAKNEIYIATLPKIRDETFSNIEKITNNVGHYSFPVFDMRGEFLYAVKQHKDKNNLFNEYTLVQIDLTNKIQKKIITNKGMISQLQLSPKGNEIAFIALGSDEMYYDSRLYVYSFDKTKTRNFNNLEDVTINLSRNIGEQPFSDVRCFSNTSKFKWLTDCSGFTVLYVNKGASVLAEIFRDLSSQKILWNESSSSISAFSRIDDKVLILLGNSSKTENIYDLQQKKLRMLIRTNEWLYTEKCLGITSKFNYIGAEGDPIDGWYITPNNYNKQEKLPTILMIHGGPQGVFGSSFMFWAQIFVACGYAVVYTNPRGSLSYGLDFALKVIEDWGNNDYIDIIKGLEYLIDLGIADNNKLGVTGWSYGGYMTNWIITRNNMFKAAVACASVTNLYSMYGTCDKGYNFLERQINANPWDSGMKLIQHSPLNYVEKINTPILLIHGENDLRCPIAQSEEMFTALKRLNKKAVLIRYSDEYHGFTNPTHIVDFLKRSIAWMIYYFLKK